jgi:hypothetical protein
MDEIYLLAIIKRLSGHPSSITRVGKCWFEKEAEHDGELTGYWYRLFLYESPIDSMLDVFFVGLGDDPGVRASAVLAERLEGGINRGKQRWRANCGPIDEDDAVQIRIESEVV